MPENRNDLVELNIDNVAHGGVAVARLEGRVVFVADAIPGERVLARIADDSKSSFWRADTVEVVEASADRVPHVWAEAALDRAPEQRAGGAEFGHISLPRQRELKADVLQDALRRFGGVDRRIEVEAIGADAPATGTTTTGTRAGTIAGRAPGTRWRTRVRLHIGPGGRIGPYAARSHTVVPVESLPLATEAIEAEALQVAEALRHDRQGAAAVEFVETSEGEVRVSLVAEEQSKTGGGSGGRSGGGGGARGQKGRAGQSRGAGKNGGSADRRLPDSSTARADRPATIVERVGDREFRLAENGFWQVHRDAAATLSDAVRSLTRHDLFDPRAANHDLYGGVGLLAAAMADEFGPATRITSVESDETATDHAGDNLAEWIGAGAVTARVDRYLTDLEKQASAEERRRLEAATMVIDPPRSGAGKQVVGSLTRLGVAQVVYVACDPVAFARDVALFRESGYELDAARAYDLFPHTHHVETVGVLVRA
ncbi:class I SAM-dependent RNA methyltransferase [Herbiconiux sp. CPCC 203407]|uniref:Class I SAM-dependent RNA methyltransferase n=1 Tax=Herbiconiux oxytropis TaxID=2970915 RepID=A0AA41XC84_9MICO|nr:class I SAM-dependent RNA methyltransferase [Herbiconiux oxytropis]MCS5721983.1 class I SAM-dependent RNA methyltransferase [Herbiconiux oxytropis]MCS5725566.1 class I SAM-dependent RNA methyltransferase [Herbiconiux oxytropis]